MNANKESNNYTERNWDVFSDWCVTKVFPAIKSRKKKKKLFCWIEQRTTKLDEEDRRPVTSWNKKRLADAIVRWGDAPVEWPEQ